MGARQRRWAARARAHLIQILGGVCRQCGGTEHLELDCITPRGHFHHTAGMAARTIFYRREHFQFQNLQVLCAACHIAKSAAEHPLSVEGRHRRDRSDTWATDPSVPY